ncbi:MAG: hypothetical protein LiPW39_617 [Parcubacteria group bacterium LiPW_39]|nr:MAG: hypothetical protein LiPW39_617 [Parcubacteria group bacterium LiPW_39]
MKKREVILVIDEELEEAREKISLVYSILQHQRRHRDYSILPEAASHETTLARCRNLQPSFVFLAWHLVLKREFFGLAFQIKEACPRNSQFFVFDNNDDLEKIIKREIKEVKNEHFDSRCCSACMLEHPGIHLLGRQ